MKLEDVTALARAGFTAQQIAKLMQLDSAPVDSPKHDPEPSPESTHDSGDSGSGEDTKTIADLFSAVADLQKQIQTSNLLAAQQSTSAQPDADQIIASIINPPVNSKEAK